MAEVVGVRFKEVGKVYYFNPVDNKLNCGDMVIVEPCVINVGKLSDYDIEASFAL